MVRKFHGWDFRLESRFDSVEVTDYARLREGPTAWHGERETVILNYPNCSQRIATWSHRPSSRFRELLTRMSRVLVVPHSRVDACGRDTDTAMCWRLGRRATAPLYGVERKPLSENARS
jgi:hypothetical protein